MKNKLVFKGFVVAFVFIIADASENIASPKQLGPLKRFSPPPIINPNIALGYYPENQFDHTSRDSYFSVIAPLDAAYNPLHFSGGYFNNASYETALLRVRETNTYMVLNTHHTNANSYKSGGGQKIDFGYDRFGANAILGAVLNPTNEVQFKFIYDNIDDDKQPQYNMDAIETSRTITHFNYRLGDMDLGNTLNLELSYIDFHREADNFSLRAASPMQVKMEVDRNIFNTQLKYDSSSGGFHNLLGVNYTYDTHIAKRYGRQGSGDFHFNGYRFPDIVQNEYGLFDTLVYEIPHHKVAFGVEYDYNKAEVRALNEIVGQIGTQIITPHNIWQNHYGESFSGKINQDALSLSSKYDFSPTPSQTYSLGLESIERIPSNEERFVSLNPPGPMAIGQGWASNPNLKPERRNRIKTAFSLKDKDYIEYMESRFDNNAWQISAGAVLDIAKDFIIFDRARGQNGSNPNYPSGNIISRNINATLANINMSGALNFWENFGTKIKVYYNYGKNRSDERALYQIAPLEAIINLDYQNYASFGRYAFGTALRAVSRQNKGDFDATKGLGIDRKMGGFVIWDLYGSITLKDVWGLRFGINNVLDKKYSEYISGSHVESIAPTNIVYAPGRSFYIALHGKF